MKIEQPGFYDRSDLRFENRELAFKMIFRELRSIGLKQVDSILDRWKVQEEEIGSRLSVATSFPVGVVRNQWFYDEQGNPYSLKHDGRDEQVKKKPKKVKR